MKTYAAQFVSTRWTVVLAAGHGTEPEALEAMETLCRAYWYPLYAYVRRIGRQSEDAQDLIQGFFARLIDKGDVAMATPTRGRFRSFLLTSLKHFLANEWDRAGAKKRGGGRAIASIHTTDAESRYSVEPAHGLTPERLFERRWAITLLDGVFSELAQQYAAEGKSHLFERIKRFLVGQARDQNYAQVAAECNMTAAAIAMAVHRLRKRYRTLLRAHIATTVESDEDVEDEILFLFDAVRQK